MRSASSLRRAAALVAAGVAAVTAAALLLSGALSGLEHDTVAARFSLRPAHRPSQVVIVAVDDKTFADLGVQWPFPRSLHARVIDRLHAAGAKVIAYDVQFTEPTQPRQDMALYDAVARAGGAVLATTEIGPHGETSVLGGDANLAQIHGQAAAAMLPATRDGEIDRFRFAVSHLRSLAVVAAQRAGRRLSPRAFGVNGALIDYQGGSGTFRTVSFSDVLRGRVPPSTFRGKVVVVGATAPSLQDLHATPASDGLMSGPEVQANAIWTALHGLPLHEPPGWLGALLVVALALLAPLLRLRLAPLRVALLALLVAGAYVVVAQETFDGGLELPVAAPLVALALGALAMVVASYAAEIAERLRVARANDVLGAEVRRREEQLHRAQYELVRRLAQAAESRDGDTGLHIERMARLCRRLAEAAELPEEELEMIEHAAALHDVGKIAIPDSILLKPGRLDPAEWRTMQAHTTIGAQILEGSEFPLVQMAQTIALTHHERWDGTGYPAGLGGEEIPLVGRIAAICDVYDALTSVRPYKHAWSVAEALIEIRRQAGAQFDPRLVELFLALEPGPGELDEDLGADDGPPRLELAA